MKSQLLLTKSGAQVVRGEEEGEADIFMIRARMSIQHLAILARQPLLAAN